MTRAFIEYVIVASCLSVSHGQHTCINEPNTACAARIPNNALDKQYSDDALVSLVQTRVHVLEKTFGEQPLTDANNLCIDDHLAPEFILLGAQKAATSTFARMFSHTNSVVEASTQASEPPHYQKELHIFDDNNGRFQSGTQFWLSHYPKCDQSKRMVATDFTPAYLRDADAPKRMLQFYGSKASQIKFGALLRNPLDRMHSAFYHYRENIIRYSLENNMCNQTLLNSGFQNYVQMVMQGEDPCRLFEGSSYGKQLSGYFDLFSPSQFTIIPFGAFTKANRSSFIIMEQWRKLGLAGVPPSEDIVNTRVHNTLEQDLDSKSLKKIQAFVSRQIGTQTVAKVLSSQNPKPELVGFDGDPADVNSVASWLEATW